MLVVCNGAGTGGLGLKLVSLCTVYVLAGAVPTSFSLPRADREACVSGMHARLPVQGSHQAFSRSQPSVCVTGEWSRQGCFETCRAQPIFLWRCCPVCWCWCAERRTAGIALHCIACEMNGRGVRERERASNTAGAGTAHTLSLSVSAHSHTPRRHCLASHETVPRTHPNTLQSVPYRALREACAAPPPAILRRDTPITRLRLVSSLASPFPIAIDNLPNLLMFDRSQPNTALPIHSTHRRTVATKRRIEN
jgi:hypothetical protein